MRLYLLHGSPWHLEKAAMFRSYLHELKAYIHAEEELLQEKQSSEAL
jgi:hypothetical protein